MIIPEFLKRKLNLRPEAAALVLGAAVGAFKVRAKYLVIFYFNCSLYLFRSPELCRTGAGICSCLVP